MQAVTDGRGAGEAAGAGEASLYGWQQGNGGGFTDRHPELLTGKATIRLRPRDAAAIADDEILGLVGAALQA